MSNAAERSSPLNWKMTIGLSNNTVIAALGDVLVECCRQKLVSLRENESKGTEKLRSGREAGGR